MGRNLGSSFFFFSLILYKDVENMSIQKWQQLAGEDVGGGSTDTQHPPTIQGTQDQQKVWSPFRGRTL